MRLLVPLVLFASLVLAASAQAATVAIPGSPMTLYVNDAGNVTGRLSGDTANVFFGPGDNDSPNAGFTLGFPATVGSLPAGSNFGPIGTSFAPVSQSGLTGAGTGASPYQVTTVYTASGGSTTAAEITQTVSYVNGDSRFDISYSVRNPTAAPIRFRAGEYADLYLAGSDVGTGVLDPGPPRLIGGLNVDGRVGGIEEVATSPWDRYEEDAFSTVSSNLADLAGVGLDNTINPSEVDNGVAVQWDDFFISGLPAGQAAAFRTVWTFAGLFLSPDNAELMTGRAHTVAVTLRNPRGAAVAGTPVRYGVFGVNPTSGTATTDGAGRTTITWLGRNEGLDTLLAYGDLNGNGVKDTSEPTGTATASWTASDIDDSIDAQLARLPAPQLGKAVNVAPVSGEVFVKLAAGSATHAAQSKGRGFVPLRRAKQIAVGSLLDTTRGKVRLVSAANSSGKRQQGDFNGAFFKALQSRSGKGLTELRLASGKFSGCTKRAKRSKRASAARRRYKKRTVRRLTGSAKGRFRTRGRYASATVRGTKWTVTDRCDGTLTRVTSGVVVVRDLRRRKNLVVRAGKSRLVRAPG